MKEPYSFDLKRIFLGELPLWFLAEIVFRTTIIYAYTLLLVRLLGKRGLGQLSPFDFVIVIALGSAVGDPMFYQEVPLIHTMLVITVVVLLQRGVSRLTEKSALAERFIDSEPRRLVRRGVVDLKNLRDEQLDPEELFSALRVQGVRQLGEVQLAYIEPSGAISVLNEPEPQPGRPLIARSDPDFPKPHRTGQPAPRTGRYACDDCGLALALAEDEPFPQRCANCPSERWLGVSESPFTPPSQQAS
ncbi:MAG TPA: DUF421 domain-containing protein [Polyangiales bacterium]|nr:DUF421 domain-containing protein [Polyangiales bacterium]